MPQTRTCPRGHEWSGDAADCPDCADDDWKQSLGSTIDDELPPPPRSVRIASPALTAGAPIAQSGSMPVIPGYELLDELGRGGMGTVYRAKHLSLNRLVALKVISAGGAADAHELVRFRAEAEAVAQLQHPNIVQVYEVGDASGRPYLALELVAGGTLAQALSSTPIAARPAAELLETLARAVQYAHSKGVVHRDLKPGNILLAVSDQRSAVSPTANWLTDDRWKVTASPKVADFGLAKRLGVDSSQTTTGVVVGTPSYMAPEQAAGLGKLVGPACDIYALGAILYELLTGRPPFRAASPVKTLQQVMSIDPVPPARLQPGVPHDLETICLKCLQKESRKRYAAASDLADDLRRFLDGRPILARRTPVWERAMKWARRRPTAAALVVVSTMAAIALTGLGIRYYRALDRHNTELAQAATDLARERDEARHQTNVADMERRRAEENLEHAMEAVDQCLTRVGLHGVKSVPYIEGARVNVLQDALAYCDKLLAIQPSNVRLRVLRAHTLEASASVLAELNRFNEALARYEEASKLIAELRRQADPELPTDRLRRIDGRLFNNRGIVFSKLGNSKRAREDHEAALAIKEKLLADRPDDPELLYEVAISHTNLAGLAADEGDATAAQLSVGRARSQTDELTRRYPDDSRFPFVRGSLLKQMGYLYLQLLQQPARAAPYYEEAVAIWRKLHAVTPYESDREQELAQSLVGLGTALLRQGYLKRAEELYAEATVMAERNFRDHPEVPLFTIQLAWCHYYQADVYRLRSDFTKAEVRYTVALDRIKALAPKGPEHPRVGAQTDAGTRELLRNVYRSRGLTRTGLKQFLGAADDLGRAAEFAQGEYRVKLLVQSAKALADAGEPLPAAEQADAALKAPQVASESRLLAARVFALAARSAKERKDAEGHARRAVGELTQVEASGGFRDPDAREVLDDPDFAILRGRADFEAIRTALRRP